LVIADILGRSIISGEVVGGDKIKLLAGEGKDEYKVEKLN
jgi:hypothetical protein